MTVTFEALSERDLSEADALLTHAYEKDMTGRLARYRRWAPGGWFGARQGGALVAMGGAVAYDRLGYLGLIAVDPRAQRGGLGRAITQHLCAWLRQHGSEAILLDASAMGEPLYRRLGFATDDHTVRLVRDGLPMAAPESGARAGQPRPASAPEARAITGFDAAIFGARREAIIAGLLAEFPCFVTTDARGELSGYVVAQRTVIGPWLARDLSTAAALLERALALSYDAPPQVMMPACNRAGIDLAAGFGFREVRTFAHMRLGGSGPYENSAQLFGRASLATG